MSSASIALAGNPNCGKTTLFNALTGSRQHVGNYPGVTVEKKNGVYSHNGTNYDIVDLPGTYSLSAYSLEEVVARDYILKEKPRVVINIVDASNLERNLYLTLQFMEMGIPVCIALNMMDVAEKRGIKIDIDRLSKLLDVPIISTVARSGEGKELLMDEALSIPEDVQPSIRYVSYGDDIDQALLDMTAIIEEADFLTDSYPVRYIALKYLENDKQILELGEKIDLNINNQLRIISLKTADHLSKTLDIETESLIADYRYGHIKALLKNDVISFDKNDRYFSSDRIDKVLTNRFIGPIIMVGVFFSLYQFTFSFSEAPVGWFESFFGWLGGALDSNLADGMLKSLLISGVIDGAGGVLGFVPLIAFMFLGISFLEDSGYLARVAYMLDRVFALFGLHGSSVMPYIISGGIAGGCAVPGVMATRTLKSRKERIATLLTAPFMNCGAKLPVFALLVGTFFNANQAGIMLVITGVAWLGAMTVAKVLRSTVVKGESSPFVMELPPYRLPTFQGLMIHTWERTWGYIKKAGTIILGISILLWAMMTFPGNSDQENLQFETAKQSVVAGVPVAMQSKILDGEKVPAMYQPLQDRVRNLDGQAAQLNLKNSIAGMIGVAMESITKYAGLDWRTNIALVGGFAAKEVIVTTLGTAYSLGADVDPEDTGSLGGRLVAAGWTPLLAIVLIIFTIFYAPCFVTVACLAKEAGSWKWGAFSMIFNTVLAFSLATIVYQVGHALGF